MEIFLAIVITAGLVYYVLRFVMRLVGPWLVRTFLKRFMGVSRPTEDSIAVRTDDGIVLRPRLHEGERISDRLGYDYSDIEEETG